MLLPFMYVLVLIGFICVSQHYLWLQGIFVLLRPSFCSKKLCVTVLAVLFLLYVVPLQVLLILPSSCVMS